MFESGYYPMGAENDPRAPWNQLDEELPAVEVEVEYSCTLRKRVTVYTTDYHTESWCDSEWEDGEKIKVKGTDVVFDKSDFSSDYKEEHMTPAQLFLRLKHELKRTLERHPELDGAKSGAWAHIISECERWQVEDEFVERV